MPYAEITLLNTRELLSLPDPEWLIQDIIPKGGFVGLVGAYASAKSFIALDWAMCLSQGLPWLGAYATQQAPVVYVAAEGGRGIKKRVKAWMQYHHCWDLPAMYWLLEPLYVREEGAVEEFLECLEAEDVWPGLVVIDTLSRSFGGGEENASADMGHFVDQVTKLARGRHMAALVIHHKNATGTRERGHTSFGAGLDTMFSCTAERTGTRITRITLTNDKQKDAPEIEPVYLAPIASVGESLVFERTTGPGKKDRQHREPAPMRKQDMLALLGSQEQPMTFSEWRYAAQIPRRTFARRVHQLMEDGEIQKEEGRYSVIPAVADLAELGRDDD